MSYECGRPPGSRNPPVRGDPPRANGVCDRTRGGDRILVLPHPHHQPACLRETSRGVAVAPSILVDLLPPPARVRLRPAGVLGASVPETAVHEDGDPRGSEDNVRVTAGA